MVLFGSLALCEKGDIFFVFVGWVGWNWDVVSNKNTLRCSFPQCIYEKSHWAGPLTRLEPAYVDPLRKFSHTGPRGHDKFENDLASWKTTFLSFSSWCYQTYVAGNSKIFLEFSPLFTWGDDPIWRPFFSIELKPPTSLLFLCIDLFFLWLVEKQIMYHMDFFQIFPSWGVYINLVLSFKTKTPTLCFCLVFGGKSEGKIRKLRCWLGSSFFLLHRRVGFQATFPPMR